MTTVLFIRHGYSEGNLLNQFHGHTDGDLTPKGHEQAKLTAAYLKDRHIDAIYSSDLMRAYKTALHIAESRNLEIVTDENLREIQAGEWEGKNFDELSTLYPTEFKIWFDDPANFVSPGGESMKQFFERITGAIEHIVKMPENDGKTIAVATHATPIRALNCTWLGKNISAFNEIEWAGNASVSEIVYDVDADGNLVIKPVCINYTKHLGDISTSLAKNI